ncbi:hypothetical protein [Micromonospora sp. NPDC000442]|uniref:hypothetical protein n=1 Tax=Micromonospora sp. NPDC000442 TaxID=3364217 RepID=UPI00368AEBCB
MGTKLARRPAQHTDPDALAFTAVTVVRLLAANHGMLSTRDLLAGGTETFQKQAREALRLLGRMGVVQRGGARGGGSRYRLTQPVTAELLTVLRPGGPPDPPPTPEG